MQVPIRALDRRRSDFVPAVVCIKVGVWLLRIARGRSAHPAGHQRCLRWLPLEMSSRYSGAASLACALQRSKRGPTTVRRR
jgi:hypothetical protein